MVFVLQLLTSISCMLRANFCNGTTVINSVKDQKLESGIFIPSWNNCEELLTCPPSIGYYHRWTSSNILMSAQMNIQLIGIHYAVLYWHITWYFTRSKCIDSWFVKLIILTTSAAFAAILHRWISVITLLTFVRTFIHWYAACSFICITLHTSGSLIYFNLLFRMLRVGVILFLWTSTFLITRFQVLLKELLMQSRSLLYTDRGLNSP